MAKRPRSKDPITAYTSGLLRGETDDAYLNTLNRISRAAAGMPQSQAVEPTRPVPRPARGGMKSSRVPTPRPDDLMERRKAADSADAAYRASRREAEDIEMGREMRGYAGGGMVKGYEAGGMVRGCKAGQMTGKKFSGSY